LFSPIEVRNFDKPFQYRKNELELRHPSHSFEFHCNNEAIYGRLYFADKPTLDYIANTPTFLCGANAGWKGVDISLKAKRSYFVTACQRAKFHERAKK